MDNSEQRTDTNFFNKYMEHLEKLIKGPPYLMFFFVSAVLLMISLIYRENYFRFFFILLIYSMTGVMLRHATNDLRVIFKKNNSWLTGIYQLFNLVLIIILIILFIALLA